MAVDIASARGFIVIAVNDVRIKGDNLEFLLEHYVVENFTRLMTVEISFKELISNREQYMIQKLEQEIRKYSNDNYRSGNTESHHRI